MKPHHTGVSVSRAAVVKTVMVVVGALLAGVLVVAAGGIGAAALFLSRTPPLIRITSKYQVGRTPAGATGTTLHISGQNFSSNSSITFLLDVLALALFTRAALAFYESSLIFLRQPMPVLLRKECGALLAFFPILPLSCPFGIALYSEHDGPILRTYLDGQGRTLPVTSCREPACTRQRGKSDDQTISWNSQHR